MSGSSGASSTSATAYLLDTGILVYSLRGDAAINARIAREPLLFISSIVLGENYTMEHSDRPVRSMICARWTSCTCV
jgi:hypothetical protein